MFGFSNAIFDAFQNKQTFRGLDLKVAQRLHKKLQFGEIPSWR